MKLSTAKRSTVTVYNHIEQETWISSSNKIDNSYTQNFGEIDKNATWGHFFHLKREIMRHYLESTGNYADSAAYILRTLSFPPLTTLWPSGLQSTVYTSSAWPGKSTVNLLELISHSFSVESWLPLTKSRLSADHAIWYTLCTWPRREAMNLMKKSVCIILRIESQALKTDATRSHFTVGSSPRGHLWVSYQKFKSSKFNRFKKPWLGPFTNRLRCF